MERGSLAGAELHECASSGGFAFLPVNLSADCSSRSLIRQLTVALSFTGNVTPSKRPAKMAEVLRLAQRDQSTSLMGTRPKATLPVSHPPLTFAIGIARASPAGATRKSQAGRTTSTRAMAMGPLVEAYPGRDRRRYLPG